MRPEEEAARATFGGFGVAVVREVCTPEFLRRRLGAALSAALDAHTVPDLLEDLAAVSIGMPRLIGDDGYECGFAVTVRGRFETGVGPRLLAMGVDTDVELDLTVRVRTFHPAIVSFDIDPVSPDDLRLSTRARSDLLPLPRLGGGVPGLARATERSLLRVSEAMNRALEASAERRRFDVLEPLRRFRPAAAVADTEIVADIGAGDGTRPGDRIDFAQFGEALARGVDAATVARLVSTYLADGARFELDTPVPMRGAVTAHLHDVTPAPVTGDELGFLFTLDIAVELLLRPDTRATQVTATLRVPVRVRVWTSVDPAVVVVSRDPVSKKEVRLLEVRRRFRDRWLPMPRYGVGRLIRGRVADELNARLEPDTRSIVVAELVDELLPEPGHDTPPDPNRRPDGRRSRGERIVVSHA